MNLRSDRFLTTAVVQPCMRALSHVGTSRRAVPILMYHSITEDPEPRVPDYYRLHTTPARFRQQMTVIRDAGYSACSLGEAVRWVRENPQSRIERKRVVITFDDGFHDTKKVALPVLEEMGFTATVFLPTAHIGHERREFLGRECLTWREAREMWARGIEFGSHTVNHPKLWELDQKSLRRELNESRERLEQELDDAVELFAHPYAFPVHDAEYVERFQGAMDEAGYRIGVTTALGRMHAGDDLRMLKRLPVNDADDGSLLLAKLEGAYDWLAFPQRWVKRVKSIVAKRRSRRRGRVSLNN